MTQKARWEKIARGWKLASYRCLACLAWPALLCLLLLTLGCLALSPAQRAYQEPHRAHPEAARRARGIKAPAIVPPDIRISALSAGGVTELREEWSAQGRENVLRALQARFKGQRVTPKTVPLDQETREILEEIRPLFRAVSLSILRHTYSPSGVFLTKLEQFEYSIGSIERILEKNHADALILVYGFDEISTGGRRTLQALGTILPFGIAPSAGTTGLSAALVDRSGTILWYNIEAHEGGYDLRDPDSAARFVGVTFVGFPRLGP